MLHALELAEKDLLKWCGNLSDAALNARPAAAPPLAFHIRHMARSLDRLLTYAEGRDLSEAQIALLQKELDPGATREQLLSEFRAAVADASARVRTLASANLEAPRTVGRKRMPTTLAGLLVHVADHTQRHIGQAITMARITTSK